MPIRDPSAVSVSELCAMLEVGAAQGQQHFVIVFHCFSTVKPKDEAYGKMRPDRIVIRRLAKLANYLAKNSSRCRVTTLGALAAEISSLRQAEAPIVHLPFLPAIFRKSEQLLNRCYWL